MERLKEGRPVAVPRRLVKRNGLKPLVRVRTLPQMRVAVLVPRPRLVLVSLPMSTELAIPCIGRLSVVGR